jgi:pyruvate formate-lyase activating enzyme-like uncharacterized protein
MAEVIDITKYRQIHKKIKNNLGQDLPIELYEKIDTMVEEYISKLNNLDHSFTFEGSPEAGKIIQAAISKIHKDYQSLICELLEKLAFAEAQLYAYKNL